MLTVTLTFQNSEHQIVLVFDKVETAMAALKTIGSGVSLSQTFADDYGQVALFKPSDLLNVVVQHVEKHWQYRNNVSLVKLRAEADFNQKLGEDPTMRFLVGGAKPAFGSN